MSRIPVEKTFYDDFDGEARLEVKTTVEGHFQMNVTSQQYMSGEYREAGVTFSDTELRRLCETISEHLGGA
ncbi:hypothetical protein PUV47_01310 [Pseudovibrio exalbescens]|uniref:hypothetical protein n=1 Tax=Pseudovibrio exalbescens TaxID=197461 RepID=UPI002365CD1F|nr:hypothetical protein [Pseudovibrio exalbescens]MDD7908539.1 hypothetical protein [Pseudovibrio exalbescens]